MTWWNRDQLEEKAFRTKVKGILGLHLGAEFQGTEVGQEEGLLEPVCSRTKNKYGKAEMKGQRGPSFAPRGRVTREWR